MEDKLRPAVEAAIQFLEQHNYRYAIIGGIAHAQWGTPRYTQDEEWLGQFAEVLEAPEILAEYKRLLAWSKDVD